MPQPQRCIARGTRLLHLAIAVRDRRRKRALALAGGVGQGEYDGAAVGGRHQLDNGFGEAVGVGAAARELISTRTRTSATADTLADLTPMSALGLSSLTASSKSVTTAGWYSWA